MHSLIIFVLLPVFEKLRKEASEKFTKSATFLKVEVFKGY